MSILGECVPRYTRDYRRTIHAARSSHLQYVYISIYGSEKVFVYCMEVVKAWEMKHGFQIQEGEG